VCGTNIHKTYLGPQQQYQIQHLQEIYHLLKEKKVPNVDRLELAVANNSHSESVVYLAPKGMPVDPKTVEEVFDAIGCVLKALIVSSYLPLTCTYSGFEQAMHHTPKPVFHRDIRWPNVMKRADEPEQWFLIDFKHAASLPTLALGRKELEPATHCAAVYKDGHGTEVDLWAVGALVMNSVKNLPRRLLRLGQAMQSNRQMTAYEALEELSAIQRNLGE
jgi:hypothetical protein